MPTRTLRIILIFIVTLLMITIPSFHSYQSIVAASSGPGNIPLTSGHAVHYGTVNLADINGQETGNNDGNQGNKGSLHSQSEQNYQDGKNLTGQSGFTPPGQETKNLAEPAGSAGSSPSIVNATQVFEGVSGVSPNPCRCTPPDPNLGVGPYHVFDIANTAGIIYYKNGTVAKPVFPLTSFFATTGSLSDPTVFYDSISGRWFASIIDITNGALRIAVSTGNDPTGTFNLYANTVVNMLPDQPFIGTNDNNFVITVNEFDTSGTSFIGAQYWILNKSELLANAANIDYATNTPDANAQTIRPVRHLSSTPTFYMVTNCVGSCVLDQLSTTNTVRLYTVTGTPPGAVNVSTQSFSISTSTSPPNAQQPGTSTLVSTNDNRILSAVYDSGTLWMSWADACIPNGDTVSRSCARLVEATISSGIGTRQMDFDYATRNAYLYYPAVSQYKGELILVYGKSSSTQYPSLYATGRLSTDPVNTMRVPISVRLGSAPDTSTRYGDYFGAATDPNPSGSSTFWVAGEYRSSSVGSQWNTAIGEIGTLGQYLTINANTSAITLHEGSTGLLRMNVTSRLFNSNMFNGSLIVNSQYLGPPPGPCNIPCGLTILFEPSTIMLVGNSTVTSKMIISTTLNRTLTGRYNVNVTLSSSNNCNCLVPTLQLTIDVTSQLLGTEQAVIGRTSTFSGYSFQLNGQAAANNRTVTGYVSLTVTNSTSGTRLFSKNYYVSFIGYSNVSAFVLAVPLQPYWLATSCRYDFQRNTISCFQSRDPDINRDGRITINDMTILGAAYASSPGMSNWNPLADMNADGRITINDCTIAGGDWQAPVISS